MFIYIYMNIIFLIFLNKSIQSSVVLLLFIYYYNIYSCFKLAFIFILSVLYFSFSFSNYSFAISVGFFNAHLKIFI